MSTDSSTGLDPPGRDRRDRRRAHDAAGLLLPTQHRERGSTRRLRSFSARSSDPSSAVQRFADDDEAHRLGQRRSLWSGRLCVDRPTLTGPSTPPARSSSVPSGSTTTSYWSPRCRTAATSSPVTARIYQVYGIEDYTQIKHVMAKFE